MKMTFRIRFAHVASVMMVVVAAHAVACGGGADASRQHLERGDAFVAEGKFTEAILEYRNAVESDARSGEARYRLAKALEASGRTPDTFWREFVRAADLMPENADVQIDASRILLLTGQTEDARTRVEAVLKRDPKNIAAHVLRGTALAGLKDLATATADFETAIELAPTTTVPYLNAAAMYAAQGRQDQAEAAFRQAIAAQPKEPRAQVAIGNYYWVMGRLPDAEAAMKSALALDDANLDANRALASIYLRTNRLAEAEAPLRALASAGNAFGARLTLADYYTAAKRPGDALKLLDELAARKETFAAATSRKAGLLYTQGRRAEAHALLDGVLQKEPNNAQVIVVKGGWLLGEKNVEGALAQARAAVKADTKSAAAQSLLATVHIARGKPEEALKSLSQVVILNPRDINAPLQLSAIHLAAGRKDQALQFAEQAVKVQPLSGAAHLVLARALLSKGDVVRADREVALVSDAAPDLPEVHTLKGQIEQRRGNSDAARRSYDRSLALAPGSVEALQGLVQLDQSAKQLDRAQDRVEKQLAAAPRDLGLLLLASRTHAAAANLPRAEALARRAVEVAPSSFDAYHLLGQLYVRQKKLAEATREYETIVKQQPQNVTARTMVGMLLLVQNRQGDARKQFEEVLGIDPRAAIAANNLAYMHAEAGENLDVALNLAQTAKAASPEDPNVNDTLGWVFYKRNLPGQAIDALRQAVAKDPSNPTYQYHLGLAYVLSKESGNARVALEQALKLNLPAKEAAEARKALAEMQS